MNIKELSEEKLQELIALISHPLKNVISFGVVTEPDSDVTFVVEYEKSGHKQSAVI